MSLPLEFISSIHPLLDEETESFLDALAKDAPISIRLNSLKTKRNPMAFVDEVNRVPWSDVGFYLNHRPAFTFDPLFHAGYYYVQEASSMFVEHVVKEWVKEPALCLDLCAAPGGKSIGMLSALPEGSLLVSNEIVRQRANVLSENVTKFGDAHSIVTNNAPDAFSVFSNLFDVMLVDAPCSGEGMFRKDEVAVQEWSPQNVQMCAARQKDILSDLWSSLKPGGTLIYSTCTYNTLENEETARWIAQELGAEFIPIPVIPEWNISPSAYEDVIGYRFFPHKTNGEGLFVCVLRKKPREEESVSSSFQKKKQYKPLPLLKEISEYARLLKSSENYHFIEDNNKIVAFPREYGEHLSLFRQRLKVISAGIEIGERKGKDFIPAQSLAMSIELNPDAFPTHEVFYDQAVSYLQKNTVVLEDAPRGFLLLTYKNEPLGFVKNLGNRANNLYPQEWRVRSGYLPEKLPNLFQ